ncbi:MAG TPA: MarR family winged helix-turn-helix transcriptional regulator [Gemmatimonadales bacterium]|jgi:DNA-binding MarR family transcriptional regulator|nr:MarR family winged helix-turn-helix transcriptional regulator [Gemmatimonadales bacterium]
MTQALDAIRRIISVLRRSSRLAESEVGIGGAQLFVLQQLATAPARSINELAERTYTHQSSVSVVIRRLVKQGLVERRPAPDDRRRRELRLTPAGKRLVARAPVPAQIRLINGLRALSVSQLRTFVRLFDQVVHRMGAAGEPPAMLFAEEPASGRAGRPRQAARKGLHQRRRKP